MSKVQQMSADCEKVLEGIEEKLLTQSATDLNDMCAALSLTVDKNEKDLPCKLRRRILENLRGTSQKDEGMSLLSELNDKIVQIH